jgi:hypothetical protein
MGQTIITDDGRFEWDEARHAEKIYRDKYFLLRK